MFQGKVPSNVRQRYLNTIVEECLKIYNNDKDRAYPRATKEEEECHSKSKNRNIYLNLAVNCIKKLRTEAAEAKAKGGSSSSSGQSSALEKQRSLTTHLQVLAGKAGAQCSWSIEKVKTTCFKNCSNTCVFMESNRSFQVKPIDPDKMTPDMYYSLFKRYVLKDEELYDNGYPIAVEDEPGLAKVKAERKFKPGQCPVRSNVQSELHKFSRQ